MQTSTNIDTNPSRPSKAPHITAAQLARVLLAESEGDREEAADKLVALTERNRDLRAELLALGARTIMYQQQQAENQRLRKTDPSATEFPTEAAGRLRTLRSLYDTRLNACDKTLGEATYEDLERQAQMHDELAKGNTASSRWLRLLSERLARDKDQCVQQVWTIDEIRAVAKRAGVKID